MYGPKIEKIFARCGGKLDKRLEQDRTASDFDLGQLISADPTDTKIYLCWILESYISNGIKLYEDIGSRVKPALEDYSYLVTSGRLNAGGKPWENERDINNYCGLVGCKKKGFEKPGLDGLIARYSSVLDERKEKQDELANIKSESEVVYEDENWTVVWPKTEAASCYYGQGTQWCTAATRGGNQFDKYNKDGPLYVMIPKQPKYTGEKYQLHVKTKSLMNEQDDKVEPLEFDGIQFEPLREWIQKIKDQHALERAAEIDDVDTVKRLWSHDPSDEMPLRIAVTNNSLKVAEYLANTLEQMYVQDVAYRLFSKLSPEMKAIVTKRLAKNTDWSSIFANRLYNSLADQLFDQSKLTMADIDDCARQTCQWIRLLLKHPNVELTDEDVQKIFNYTVVGSENRLLKIEIFKLLLSRAQTDETKQLVQDAINSEQAEIDRIQMERYR